MLFTTNILLQHNGKTVCYSKKIYFINNIYKGYSSN